jgi:hypothetical protein
MRAYLLLRIFVSRLFVSLRGGLDYRYNRRCNRGGGRDRGYCDAIDRQVRTVETVRNGRFRRLSWRKA